MPATRPVGGRNGVKQAREIFKVVRGGAIAFVVCILLVMKMATESDAMKGKTSNQEIIEAARSFVDR